MKALSIKQPWADAIIYHGKDIENRDWNLRHPLLGLPQSIELPHRIAIHASKGLTKAEYEFYIDFMEELNFNGDIEVFTIPEMHEFVRGAILGTVEIVDCVQKSDSPSFQGEFGFVLRKPIPLKIPIPFRGTLGFWEVPKKIESQITEEI